MPKAMLVTGFVPLYLGSHRSHAECMELAPKLLSLPVDIKSFEWTLDQCWLYRYVQSLPFKVTVSDSDHPWHKRLAMHCVIHQATEWMRMAAEESDHDVFIFIDYTIYHHVGITDDVILSFLERAKYEEGIAIPGEWEPQDNWNDQFPNWRFGGTHVIAHRRYLEALDLAVKVEAMEHVRLTGNVSWQINTWARVEQRYPELPIRWYYAPFDERLFNNYQVVLT